MKPKTKEGVEAMIQQTVMPFKLKRTEERMTPRSGLVLYAEFMKAMGVDGLRREMTMEGGSVF